MKELIKKQIYLIFKQSNNYLELIKQLLIFLLNMIIIVYYYYLIYKYIIDSNSEIVITTTITMEKSISTEIPNI